MKHSPKKGAVFLWARKEERCFKSDERESEETENSQKQEKSKRNCISYQTEKERRNENESKLVEK